MIFSRRLILEFKLLCCLEERLNFEHQFYSKLLLTNNFCIRITLYAFQQKVNSTTCTFMLFSRKSKFNEKFSNSTFLHIATHP